jgi:3',5'-cyclic AMP phosphodiesterase CpdA
MHLRTADLVRQIRPHALLLLGDLQYESGSPQDFAVYFDRAFGEFRSITYPVPGNHEYLTRGASGYFDYFNGTGADSGRAGSRRRGYYSFDLGSWHIVALNSNCRDIGGCGARSAQARWLRADLAANPRTCTLAFMHSARFSSGEHGNDELMRDIWQILFDGEVDLVLAGHDHSYERFGPQDAAGRANLARGVRSFVVGTGGKGTGLLMRGRANSEFRDNTSVGWLQLILRPTDNSWRFVSVPEHPLSDSGSAACEPT